MNSYEKLLSEADDNNIIVREVSLISNSHGLYKNNRIALNKNTLNNMSEKACVLAEELGHHYTSYGNILDLNKVENSKQEYKARLMAYNKLIGLKGIIDSFNAGCKTITEMAEYLDVTEKFLNEALECYKSKYGFSATLDNYVIFFEPRFSIMNANFL
ncbi:TPA: ImmA/IrrE family metallo-endopeptidase [Clostridioides difficile]|uniref:ImmA/IrrE family metallo-endopeptidase n=1 Tax=Clostridioides difficile TaxID=1496 RepID=UPI00038CC726|nr:ImmA/IrrE family metallo-endopeptidase [Clostridioides difficile]EAA0000200.1 ImmA/IrrE family metallo-endopeptidase [Clostridioides difficile]EGT3661494.1 ImmA/IrrE family metallo-endopeptidase [Clostridioides difficile]EGT3728961.1 ImmA/IrrE family metallo-endopeptidase [Clostridioides difficile]EGT3732027.1 ImmA/IrrE family metallo-endopeptidase [Clostridioides difficile]EGT3771063.1 ImmA/IrrE family metallo-endopeptidase [Clostridioides difficile]